MGERGQVFRETWLNRCYKSLVTSNPSCLQPRTGLPRLSQPLQTSPNLSKHIPALPSLSRSLSLLPQLLEEVSAALSRYVTEPQESELRQQALFLLLGPEYTAKHFPYHRYNVRALEPPLNPQRKESYMKEARVFLDRCFSRALNDLSYPKDASRYSGDTPLGRFVGEVRAAYRESVNQQAAVRAFEELLLRRQEEEEDEAVVMRVASWGYLLCRHCLLEIQEVFGVAEEVVRVVGMEDPAFLSHLRSCLAAQSPNLKVQRSPFLETSMLTTSFGFALPSLTILVN
ncbi:hypothetical protein O3P69_017744 [Scylla paramamosain]|uniref:Uncharacterized protein n=1 Tax=Scylla paramamosain TaxID=85552 RepID=A0AAW0SGJ3_SCYPA